MKDPTCSSESSNYAKYYISEHNYTKDLGENVCTNDSISLDHCYISNTDQDVMNDVVNDENPPSLPTVVQVDHDYCQPDISIESSNQVNASDSHELSQLFDLDTLFNRSNGNIFIENTNFNIFNVPGDGNCFFHILSLAFHGHINDTENYRNTICTYVYENWEMFQEMVMLMHDYSTNTPEKYFQKMVVHNGWATAIEVKVAAILFNIDLHVHLLHSFHLQLVISRQNSSKEIFSPLKPAVTNQTIILLLHNNHFFYYTKAEMTCQK